MCEDRHCCLNVVYSYSNESKRATDAETRCEMKDDLPISSLHDRGVFHACDKIFGQYCAYLTCVRDSYVLPGAVHESHTFSKHSDLGGIIRMHYL